MTQINFLTAVLLISFKERKDVKIIFICGACDDS